MAEANAIADIKFLVDRHFRGSGLYEEESSRECGLSSDSIVNIAYGRIGLSEQRLPLDQYDLNACERMYAKLPEHRKTIEAQAAIKEARRAIKEKR